MKRRLPLRIIIFGVLLLISMVWTIARTSLSPDPSAKYLEAKELLKAGNWKQANIILVEAALKTAGRGNDGWFDEESIQRFPCADLVYLDQLSSKYSQGKFGLTAQKEVYLQTGNTMEQHTTEGFLKFAEAVGWRKNDEWIPYEKLNFSPDTAPKGELLVNSHVQGLRAPFKSRSGTPEHRGNNLSAFMQRLESCTP